MVGEDVGDGAGGEGGHVGSGSAVVPEYVDEVCHCEEAYELAC